MHSIIRRTTVSLMVAASALTAGTTSPATVEAHWDRKDYTYSGSDCRTWTDPPTIVFFGPGAWLKNVQRTLEDHSINAKRQRLWRKRTWLERNQFYGDHGRCEWETVGHLASAKAYGPSSRWHTRFLPGRNSLGAINHGDSILGFVTQVTPHHEDIIGRAEAPPDTFCHAVDKGAIDRTRADDTQWPRGTGSGFDRGREKVAGWYHSRHYFVARRKWGNTRSAKQCDGDWAGSNGYVYFIGMGF